jgi:heptosyltransferase-2
MTGSRFLVVQTAFLGDAILTTPLLRALKASSPEAYVAVVASPVGAEVLRDCPFVDETIALEKRGVDRGPLGMLRRVIDIRGRRFDVALAAQRSARSGVMVAGSGAPVRVGFRGAAGRWAYNRRVAWRSDRHAVHRYLALLGALGADGSRVDPRPTIAVDPHRAEAVEAALRKAGVSPDDPLLAVAPGSVWATKRWTVEGFTRVVASCREELGLTPILVGSASERALCHAISTASGVFAVNLAGAGDVRYLAAILARVDLLLANDSGPGHLAAAVGTPVVTIFGPTVPSFGYIPYGDGNRVVELRNLECRPCHRHGPMVCPLGHHRCMKEIGSDEVVDAIRTMRATPPGETSSHQAGTVLPG